ncbi:MAG: InlB B-repeat-containing protein [Clostridia bacterium]|nr:InlB B-repeat-containing protein [Clostridia bacterium]
MKKLLKGLCIAALTLCAFTACSDDEDTFTISFVQEGYTTVVLEVSAGGTLNTASIPAPVQDRVGYTAKWTRTGFIDVKSNQSVGVVYVPNTYTVTYDLNGGAFTDGSALTQTVTYDASYTLKTPEWAEHQFLCWKNGENTVLTTGTWNITSNVTLKAEWLEARTVVTVAFQQDGQETVYREVPIGGSLEESQIPAIVPVPGYTVAWDRTSFENLTDNVVVNVVRTPIDYTVTYDLNGGSFPAGVENTQTVTFGSNYALKIPYKQFHTFVGWKNGEKSVATTGTWSIAENVSLTADWLKTTDTVQVAFVQEGCQTYYKEVAVGGMIPEHEIPVPASVQGYTVTWDRADFEDLTESIVVNAVLTPKTYTITYDLVGGEFEEGVLLTQEVAYNTAYELKTPTREFRQFVGWKLNGIAVDLTGTWTIAENVTLQAEWLKTVETVLVAFVQDGQAPIYREIEKGASLPTTEIPTPVPVKGYDVSWDRTDFNNLTDSVIVVNLKKTPKVYRVAFYLDPYVAGNSPAASMNVTFGNGYSTGIPSKQGYTFAGWKIIGGTYNGQYLANISTWEYDENLIVEAVWEEGDTDIYTPWV